MTNLYITEYARLGEDSLGKPNMSPEEPPLASQKLAFTTAAASNAFHADTTLVRIQPDGICSVVFGTARSRQSQTSGSPQGKLNFTLSKKVLA